jgi:hypothetical protein
MVKHTPTTLKDYLYPLGPSIYETKILLSVKLGTENTSIKISDEPVTEDTSVKIYQYI